MILCNNPMNQFVLNVWICVSLTDLKVNLIIYYLLVKIRKTIRPFKFGRTSMNVNMPIKPLQVVCSI